MPRIAQVDRVAVPEVVGAEVLGDLGPFTLELLLVLLPLLPLLPLFTRLL